MRIIKDDLTHEEVHEDQLCIISITRVSTGKPYMKPLEVSSLTAAKIKASLIEVANKGF